MESVQQPHRVRMTPGARRVLAAAERLFYERGIHAVGVDLIAAEAGVTKKTLYDRFGSKEQIVVEYLAGRDERWRELLAGHLEAVAGRGPDARIVAVFEASRAWALEYGRKGCSMINANAEIGDPSHPAHPVITGQKRWMLDLFTGLAREIEPAGADGLARTLMLLHEGALVAHGVGVFPDPFGQALEQVRHLLGNGAAATGGTSLR
ncbi:TetR/AcrR family transcriptional regulator [Streptomyces sp. SID5606]|uniref:TetR/AcrR family transcriptional regulator n=1 Tax=Streptomyces sp. SID5606 TaxID=2690305 RepID=UPI001370AA08|nr:TetR/AcrR family transcriptional regulator [Streptomyces sp. SID5606]MZD53362.1 TetR family transcriptional regulator [Streptomyces sp. SID5606]